ncbi:MAG: MOSC domain-containing protein [Halalkalicoccus sp.]
MSTQPPHDRERRGEPTEHAAGTVGAVHTAPSAGAPMESRERVEAVAGRGVRGDRYFLEEGTYSASAREAPREITLIEAETIEAVERDYGIELASGAHRRNVTTRGVALNHLVGRRFRAGEAVCEGAELCDPCSYLERLLALEGIHDALVHRGGLRCRIVQGGTIAVGDPVVPADSGDKSRPRS